MFTVFNVKNSVISRYTSSVSVVFGSDCTQSTHQTVHRVHTRLYTEYTPDSTQSKHRILEEFKWFSTYLNKDFSLPTVKGLKSTVVNRALPSLHEESIEITLTVPLRVACVIDYIWWLTIIKYVSKNNIARPLFVPYYTPILSWDSFSFLMFMFSRNLYISTLDKTLKTIIRNLFRLLLIFSVPYNYKLYILGSIQV